MLSPIGISYGHQVKIKVTGIDSGVNSISMPQVVTFTLSKDLLNQLSSSFEFTLQDAQRFFNQFAEHNPIQHGATVEVWLNDISGGILTSPPVVNGWIKKGTFHIIDPMLDLGPGSRGMNIFCADKMWSFLNSSAHIKNGTPTESINGVLYTIDDNYLVYQLVVRDPTGTLPPTPFLDLDETSTPIITKFRMDLETAPGYLNPFPAGPITIMNPSEYDVNYELGRFIFKESQSEGFQDIYGTDYEFGFFVKAFQYRQDTDPYFLEDALKEFLESPKVRGGCEFTYGTDFDFYDADGDAMSDDEHWSITGANEITNLFTLGAVPADPDLSANFPEGSVFSVKGSGVNANNGNYTVREDATFGGGVTEIKVHEDVVGVVAGDIYLYANTGIKVSFIDWNEDTGNGDEFIEYLRDNGVMPYNYFLHCDVDGKIRGEYILQKTTADKSLSRELFIAIPNTLNDIFTRVRILSNGNTLPRSFLPENPTGIYSLTPLRKSVFHDAAIPLSDPPWGWFGVNYSGAKPIEHWQNFGIAGHLSDPNPLTYFGYLAAYKFYQFVDYDAAPISGIGGDVVEISVDNYFYPFPDIPLNGTTGGFDDLAFMDYTLVNVEDDIAQLVIQFYIPPFPSSAGTDAITMRPSLNVHGNSEISNIVEGILVMGGGFHAISTVYQRPLLSITYGKVGDAAPLRGMGKEATVFELDPVKGDPKIIDVEGVSGVKTLRITFHRPFVCRTKGHDVALYMINVFQAFDRGVLNLPGFDTNHEKVLPYARVTDQSAVSSLLNPEQSGNLTSAPVSESSTQDSFRISTVDITFENLAGVTVCVPNPTGGSEPYVAEVDHLLLNQPVVGQVKIYTIKVRGQDHTDAVAAGVQNGDTAYFLNNRYWLDLLYNRIDLYKPMILNKLDSAGLKWKSQTIQNDNITDVGSAIRKAVTTVRESMENFSTVETSLVYRPDYDVGMTVDEPNFSSPKYMLTALDYTGSSAGIFINCKLVNFNHDIG